MLLSPNSCHHESSFFNLLFTKGSISCVSCLGYVSGGGGELFDSELGDVVTLVAGHLLPAFAVQRNV